MIEFTQLGRQYADKMTAKNLVEVLQYAIDKYGDFDIVIQAEPNSTCEIDGFLFTIEHNIKNGSHKCQNIILFGKEI